MGELWQRFWGFNWWVKGAVIGVLLLVVVGIIGAATDGGDDDGGSEDLEVITATNTAMAGDGAAATATSIPATPTEPALPALTAGECAYANAFLSILEDVGDASGSIGELFAEAGADPLLIFDDDWKIEVVIALATIQVAHDRLAGLQPPESLASVHAAAQASLTKLNDATVLIAGGIDDIDPDQIIEGGDLMTAAGGDIVVAGGLIDDFRATRSGEC